MNRGKAWAVAILGASLLMTGEAKAQFGYGWGFNGWGGATAAGDIERGEAAYNIGAGVFNEKTAVARSINADTAMRWNEYWWESQQEATRRARARLEKNAKRTTDASDEAHRKLIESPSDVDIASGNALSAMFHEMNDPRLSSSSKRVATAKVPAKLIKAIPFQHATEPVVISLDQLTAEDGWAPALAGDDFAKERKAYRAAIEKALRQNEEGAISKETVDEVRAALAGFRAKLKANPAAKKQMVEALNDIKTHEGMVALLQEPKFEKAIAELDKVEDTSLGNLIAFMQAFNLRFGKAVTPEQQQAYIALHGPMSSLHGKLMAALEPESPPKGDKRPERRRIPADLFNGPDDESTPPSALNKSDAPKDDRARDDK